MSQNFTGIFSQHLKIVLAFDNLTHGKKSIDPLLIYSVHHLCTVTHSEFVAAAKFHGLKLKVEVTVNYFVWHILQDKNQLKSTSF